MPTIGGGGSSSSPIGIVGPGPRQSDPAAVQERSSPSIPDILRPLTFGVYAPYRCYTVDLTADTPAVITQGSPLRVALLLALPNAIGLSMSVTTVDAPDGHILLSLGAGQTVGMMLAEYFSVLAAILRATATQDCTLSLVEFVRPR